MSDPTQDFMATRAAAGGADDAFMRQLASGGVAPSSPPASAPAGGAAQSAGPAAPVSPGTPSAPAPAGDASFGVRMENAVLQRLHEQQTRQLPSAGGFFTQDLENAWNALKTDVQKSKLPMAGDDTLMGLAGNSFARFVQSGKTIRDAAGLALSPIAGAFDEATGAAAKGAAAVTGMSAGQWKDLLDQAVGGLGNEGELGKLAEAEKAASVAKDIPAGNTAGTKGAAAAEPETEAGRAQAAAAPAQAAKSQRAFDLAGEEPGAALKVTPEVRQQAADFFAGKRDNPIAVHLDALADPDTRVQAIADIAKVIPKEAVKAIDVTEMGAYSMNVSPNEIIEQIRPKFPSDEAWAAANMAINSASDVFHELSVKAMTTGAPEDFEAATRAFAQLNDFVGGVRDAKTDWGRAGRIQQEAVKSRSDWTKSIQDAIADVGPDNVEQVIKRVATLDDPAKASPFVSSLRWMTSRDAMLYGYYNLLLSHAVVVKKIATDVGLALYNVPVRYAAEKLSAGVKNGVAPGEAVALLNGYLGSMSDAIRAAGKGLKAGQSQFVGDAQSLFDGHLLERSKALQAGTSDVHSEAIEKSPTLSWLELARMALPTSAMAAADDFGKLASYRSELHALAYREGMQKGLAGDALAQHIGDRLNNVLPDHHAQARDYALRNTLTEPLEGVARKIQEAADGTNIPIWKTGISIPLGRLILPFTKVPVNSLRYAYRNSPLPLVAPSAAYRAELAAGGARRAMAQAQVGIGTAVSMIVGALAIGGTIDGAGPSSPDLQAAWRRAGHTPYTIRIGNENARYDRVEPMGSLVSIIADTHEAMKYMSEGDADAAATSLVFGIGHAMINKTYMQGLADFLEAVHSPDRSAKGYAADLVSSMAMPGEAAMVARGLDPFIRAHRGLLEAIEARTPGVSTTLPPSRNLWGDAIPRESLFGPYDLPGRAISPVTLSGDNPQPIDKWIWDHRDDFPNGAEGRIGLEPPGQLFSGKGGKVRLTTEQLDRLKVLAGNGWKDPQTGLGARDALNALVQGEYPNRATQERFNRASNAKRAVMVANMWREYREGAKDALYREDQKLQSDLGTAVSARQQLLQAMPQPGG